MVNTDELLGITATQSVGDGVYDTRTIFREIRGSNVIIAISLERRILRRRACSIVMFEAYMISPRCVIWGKGMRTRW